MKKTNQTKSDKIEVCDSILHEVLKSQPTSKSPMLLFIGAIIAGIIIFLVLTLTGCAGQTPYLSGICKTAKTAACTALCAEQNQIEQKLCVSLCVQVSDDIEAIIKEQQAQEAKEQND